MKRIVLSIVILLLVGCARTITIVPTSIGIPLSPSQSATATKEIPSATFTVTPIPTLPTEDARKRLLDLLADNGGCQLPCLWGIMPGKSMYQDAQSILTPLKGISSIFEIEPRFDPAGGFVLPGFSEGENDLMFSTKASYLVDNQMVSRIHFYAREEQIPTDSNRNWISRRPIFGLPDFVKRVEYYSLSHLLSEQGTPASVMIASSSPSINRDGSITTHIAILYPDQGIWAEYTTLVNDYEVGNKIISCPINAHIEMELYPQGNPDAFFFFLDQTNWGRTKNGYKPLEEATSMSVDKFYQTFRMPTNKCIETPVDLWPTPELGGG